MTTMTTACTPPFQKSSAHQTSGARHTELVGTSVTERASPSSLARFWIQRTVLELAGRMKPFWPALDVHSLSAFLRGTSRSRGCATIWMAPTDGIGSTKSTVRAIGRSECLTRSYSVRGAVIRHMPREMRKIVEAAREILTSNPADTTFRLTVWDRPRYIYGRPKTRVWQIRPFQYGHSPCFRHMRSIAIRTSEPAHDQLYFHE